MKVWEVLVIWFIATIILCTFLELNYQLNKEDLDVYQQRTLERND